MASLNDSGELKELVVAVGKELKYCSDLISGGILLFWYLLVLLFPSDVFGGRRLRSI